MAGIVTHPVSAGGFVIRSEEGAVWVLLALQDGLWRVPKGMQEAGEPLQVTAIREVREETGVSAATLVELDPIGWTYEYEHVACEETCHLFVMVEVNEPVELHDGETERTEWVRLNDASKRLAYREEASALEQAVTICEDLRPFDDRELSTGFGIGTAAVDGKLALTRADAMRRLEEDQPVILALEQMEPADAALVSSCVGVISLVGGPTSHIVVVATALGIPCITGPFDLRHNVSACLAGSAVAVPPGARVRLLPDVGAVVLVAALEGMSVVRRQAVDDVDQSAAFDWARARASQFRMHEPRNWKLFKRDLLARFCPTPPTYRFASPWHVADVVEHAASLSGGTVRCSAFPPDIACHAVSVVLPTDRRGSWPSLVGSLDPDADLEVFVEQARDQMCWRLVRSDAGCTVEAGRGQAMYVFEAERGRHPTVIGSWKADGSEFAVTETDTELGASLARFLDSCGAELGALVQSIAAQLNLNVFALEGYHRDGTTSFVVCDLDLPMDRAFMTALQG